MPNAVSQSVPKPGPTPPETAQLESARPAGGKRLAWLDALRGIAALCVVFDHLTYSVLESVRTAVYQWFDPGQYGVFVFFLVSGYIVPASLERRGSSQFLGEPAVPSLPALPVRGRRHDRALGHRDRLAVRHER